MLLKMDFFIIFCSIFITNKVTNNLILSLIFKQFFCQCKMKSTTLYNILFKNLINCSLIYNKISSICNLFINKATEYILFRNKSKNIITKRIYLLPINYLIIIMKFFFWLKLYFMLKHNK